LNANTGLPVALVGQPGLSGASPEIAMETDAAPRSGTNVAASSEVKLRSAFPETWLWDMFTIGCVHKPLAI